VKQITGKALGKLLERHGWKLLRVHGSHHVYGKKGSEARLSVPMHGNKPLKKGLARYLLRQAGLSENDR
jgi:predicted RNA binding protein YcfA (HicA-like mRNA interferase family)